MKDDSENRSQDRPPGDAPDGTQDHDGDERSSNQSQMLFDESPGRFLASRGEGKFEGTAAVVQNLDFYPKRSEIAFGWHTESLLQSNGAQSSFRRWNRLEFDSFCTTDCEPYGHLQRF